MSWYRHAFRDWYPLIYAHRDVEEARRAVETLAQLAPLGTGPLLDLGCGEGRHLAPLMATGAFVVGLDLSAPLLARAAARHAAPAAGTGKALVVRGDMRALPLRDCSFSAVMSLFTTFGYFGELPAHADLLAEIARVLRPGGHWFLDYLNCLAVRRELAEGPRARMRCAAGFEIHEVRALDSARRRVIKQVTLRVAPGVDSALQGTDMPHDGIAYTEEIALFAPEELDFLAAASGLQRVASAGDYDGRRFDSALSPRWIMVYRRAVDSAESIPAACGGVP